jgi:hypothetical protein
LVLELVDGPTLASLLTGSEPFDEERTTRFATDLASACALHASTAMTRARCSVSRRPEFASAA